MKDIEFGTVEFMEKLESWVDSIPGSSGSRNWLISKAITFKQLIKENNIKFPLEFPVNIRPILSLPINELGVDMKGVGLNEVLIVPSSVGCYGTIWHHSKTPIECRAANLGAEIKHVHLVLSNFEFENWFWYEKV